VPFIHYCYYFLTEIRDQICRRADAIRGRTGFVYEMMPFFYALVKATNNENIVMELLNEGNNGNVWKLDFSICEKKSVKNGKLKNSNSK
jgi:hypothetical protein